MTNRTLATLITIAIFAAFLGIIFIPQIFAPILLGAGLLIVARLVWQVAYELLENR